MAEITPIMSDSGSSSISLPSNTFDVHTNQRLCSVLLNEFNYLPWSRSFQLALGGRSKLEFIDKSIVVPDVNSTQYKSWIAQDKMVQTWLLNSMELHVAEIFSYYESFADLWDAVKEMYGNQNNAARVFQLKRDIACLQQEGKSFVQFLGSMKSIWNELSVYRPHTTDSAAMHIASNPVFHERTKHIEVDCHYVREQVQSQLISTKYTRSQDQLADMFTKALSSAQFHWLLSKLGSINILAPA
ncbi:uncharacterized protein LOC119997007 [Tripterygium wilfordii]|uniref:uncharacterized protein LOC119997007 n=1 Tax=Tripterygium wilfordii TaxID=458696 RepID=UPI0018F83159|nr:uncharacterized protein LOC119997007 [Tripterygium wilfordii]